MRLKELDVRVFVKAAPDAKSIQVGGIAFLCPCCKREYLICCFKETSYAEQKELMSRIVDADAATWVPFPAFMAATAVNEHDLERITIRPPIDARALGHAKVTVSHGEVDY